MTGFAKMLFISVKGVRRFHKIWRRARKRKMISRRIDRGKDAFLKRYNGSIAVLAVLSIIKISVDIIMLHLAKSLVGFIKFIVVAKYKKISSECAKRVLEVLDSERCLRSTQIS